jgi:hypothetical protein
MMHPLKESFNPKHWPCWCSIHQFLPYSRAGGTELTAELKRQAVSFRLLLRDQLAFFFRDKHVLRFCALQWTYSSTSYILVGWTPYLSRTSKVLWLLKCLNASGRLKEMSRCFYLKPLNTLIGAFLYPYFANVLLSHKLKCQIFRPHRMLGHIV